MLGRAEERFRPSNERVGGRVEIQDEWDKITMDEVQAHIMDMPKRCTQLLQSQGGPIKSALW